MTIAGWPSAAEMLTSRPSASRIDAPAVGHRELLDEVPGLPRRDGERLQRGDVDLDVEVPGVADDRAVLHHGEVIVGDHVLVAGGGAEDVTDRRGLRHRHHLVPVHEGFERPHRIDLGDDDVRTEAACAQRDATPDPTVSGDDEPLPGQQHVRRTDDPVDRGLAGPVSVVEEVLRPSLVDGDHGKRECAVGFHRLEADDACRRLLHARDDVAELLAVGAVQDSDHIRSVVHRQLRFVVDSRLDVRVVRLVVLALDREDRNVEIVHQRSGDIVLRGEWVGRTEHDVRPAGLERAHEVRGLGRHVQARRDAASLKRLFTLEPLADRREDRHLPVGPHDPAHTLGSKGQILHVVSFGRRHSGILS